MPLLGLELNDTGILAAGGEPAQLLDVETGEKESPGFALAHNDQLILGKDAHDSARLHPRLYTNRFWDELSAEQIKQPALEGKTNAELAYLHLSKIWDSLKGYGDEIVLAVPGFFSHKQLGLILGITNELSMPVKGFTATAIASSTEPYPGHLLFYLDVHLHRLEITFLEQGDQLTHKETKTIPAKGLHYLYTEWIKAIADEFVRSTRFDPFDQAIYEQELFRCLPQVLKDLKGNPSTTFSMKAGSQIHSVILTYDLFARKSKLVFREVYRLIEEMKKRYGTAEMASVLEVSHRFSPLPGYREELDKLPNVQIIELEKGSGARGLLELKDRFSSQAARRGLLPDQQTMAEESGNLLLPVQKPWTVIPSNLLIFFIKAGPIHYLQNPSLSLRDLLKVSSLVVMISLLPGLENTALFTSVVMMSCSLIAALQAPMWTQQRLLKQLSYNLVKPYA